MFQDFPAKPYADAYRGHLYKLLEDVVIADCLAGPVADGRHPTDEEAILATFQYNRNLVSYESHRVPPYLN